MSTAPHVDIYLPEFHADPYPVLAQMQAETPVAFVPQLGATLITRHADIYAQEKRTQVFSSRQPSGLMTRLMGENMMRKDGAEHATERKACFPAFSPRTVKTHWAAAFEDAARQALDDLRPLGQCDLVRDYAMRVSGEALRAITGLADLSWQDMDAVSQAMIDGIANYAADPQIEARCHAATVRIDAAIDVARVAPPPMSLLAVQLDAGLPMQSIRANIKLAISGGQNEPRDAIAGLVWALLDRPEQLRLIQNGAATWQAAFEEYARWMAPIGMSPREVAQEDGALGVTLSPGDRVFLMFGIGNRDPRAFFNPNDYDITRDCRKSLSFGAGPHFCAGAAASRSLIADIALPLLFETLPDLQLTGDVPFAGWAFRGPLRLPVCWKIWRHVGSAPRISAPFAQFSLKPGALFPVTRITQGPEQRFVRVPCSNRTTVSPPILPGFRAAIG